jgi:Protein of unknown function (DUF3617)
MRTALYLAAALTLGFLTAGASARHAGAAEDGPILPGYWESTSTDSFSNTAGKTERKCITSRAINSYLTGPSNGHYTCRYDTRELNGGHAHMTGQCVDSSGISGKVVIDGDYGPEAFKLAGHLTVNMLGLKLPIDTSIDAHRISADCPAGAKIEDGGKPAKAAKDAALPPPPADAPPPPPPG